jgi:hypothetical protein
MQIFGLAILIVYAHAIAIRRKPDIYLLTHGDASVSPTRPSLEASSPSTQQGNATGTIAASVITPPPVLPALAAAAADDDIPLAPCTPTRICVDKISPCGKRYGG